LGRFELVGIPPAPRGVPHIEVTFDIDANGIVNVSAKDRATGKAQSVRITASSGLSKDEINRLIRDAQLHAAEDKEKKDLAGARNEADALIYGIQKSMKELGSKLDQKARIEIEGLILELKEAAESNNFSEINLLKEKLTRRSHQLAEKWYRQASGNQQKSDTDRKSSRKSNTDEDIADAEFEETEQWLNAFSFF
jgi:molecular chaperone DnaK